MTELLQGLCLQLLSIISNLVRENEICESVTNSKFLSIGDFILFPQESLNQFSGSQEKSRPYRSVLWDLSLDVFFFSLFLFLHFFFQKFYFIHLTIFIFKKNRIENLIPIQRYFLRVYGRIIQNLCSSNSGLHQILKLELVPRLVKAIQGHFLGPPIVSLEASRLLILTIQSSVRMSFALLNELRITNGDIRYMDFFLKKQKTKTKF